MCVPPGQRERGRGERKGGRGGRERERFMHSVIFSGFSSKPQGTD